MYQVQSKERMGDFKGYERMKRLLRQMEYVLGESL